jgi:hypothetical protein
MIASVSESSPSNLECLSHLVFLVARPLAIDEFLRDHFADEGCHGDELGNLSWPKWCIALGTRL